MRYDPGVADVGSLLRSARRHAGLSQREVAVLAEVSQPNVSNYERGRRQPTLPTLRRLLAAAGHRLSVRATPAGQPYTLAEIADDIAVAADRATRWRLVHEFLRGFRDDARDDAHRTALIADEPPRTGSRHWDALLGAVAEHLAHHHGLPCPAWTQAPSRFSDPAWFLSGLPAARAEGFATSPASFRRRGLFVGRHELDAA
jgi:transcriptional regulator with XRE-family HTH domain